MAEEILLKILLISEDASDESAVAAVIKTDGIFDLILKRVQRESEMVNALDDESWSFVVIDALLTKLPALRALEILKDRKQEIPLEARIFSLCDVWDALTTDRPYRAAMDESAALNTMRSNRENFDPQLLPVFFELIGDLA